MQKIKTAILTIAIVIPGSIPLFLVIMGCKKILSKKASLQRIKFANHVPLGPWQRVAFFRNSGVPKILETEERLLGPCPTMFPNIRHSPPWGR